MKCSRDALSLLLAVWGATIIALAPAADRNGVAAVVSPERTPFIKPLDSLTLGDGVVYWRTEASVQNAVDQEVAWPDQSIKPILETSPYLETTTASADTPAASSTEQNGSSEGKDATAEMPKDGNSENATQPSTAAAVQGEPPVRTSAPAEPLDASASRLNHYESSEPAQAYGASADDKKANAPATGGTERGGSTEAKDATAEMSKDGNSDNATPPSTDAPKQDESAAGTDAPASEKSKDAVSDMPKDGNSDSATQPSADDAKPDMAVTESKDATSEMSKEGNSDNATVPSTDAPKQGEPTASTDAPASEKSKDAVSDMPKDGNSDSATQPSTDAPKQGEPAAGTDAPANDLGNATPSSREDGYESRDPEQPYGASADDNQEDADQGNADRSDSEEPANPQTSATGGAFSNVLGAWVAQSASSLSGNLRDYTRQLVQLGMGWVKPPKTIATK